MPQTQSNSARFVALRATVPTGGRRSLASAPLPLFDARRNGGHPAVWRFPCRPACGGLCRPEVGVPLPAGHPAGCGPDLSRKWWRRRESNPRPKVFCNDVYMHIRVVGGNPRPEAPFPLSVPHRINPANRGSEPIPECSPTAREDRRQSPPRSTPFPARQAWSGRTWLLKQPVPVQCWLLFCFHRLREVDPRHAIVASCAFVEPSTPPPRASQMAIPRPEINPVDRWGHSPRTLDQGDSPAEARIMYLTHSQYLDQWERLQETLSPEAVRQGRHSDLLQATAKGVLRVDEAFLRDMESWRVDLAPDIYKQARFIDRQLSQREINHLVQRTIDRIVFLRIAEDRNLESYGRLERAASVRRNSYNEIKTLYLAADRKYNSGLFHFNPNDKSRPDADTLSLDIRIGDGILRKIIADLYPPKSRYQFSVISADILGQVYGALPGQGHRSAQR